jgi:hypothetical protein
MPKLKATIRFQRKTGGAETDDILKIYDDDEFYEMQRIEYKPAEYSQRQNQFYLEQTRTIEYLSDVLKSLTYDVDPFECVQIDTMMHPPIVYHVSDLECRETRWLIEDMLAAAIRRPVRTIKVKTDAPTQ